MISSIIDKETLKGSILNLPKGRYKTITHKTVINILQQLDNQTTSSKNIYSQDLSKLRKSMLGKQCPCSDETCKHQRKIKMIQNYTNNVSFYYVEFEIH